MNYKVNELTIKKLFHDSMGLHAEIHTYDNPLQGEWVVYEKFNIITPRFPSKDIMNFVLSQYNMHGGFHKILVRKLARIGCLSSMGLLASKSMDIYGIDSLGKNMAFWWRWSSIRLFDFSTGHVTCVSKEGLPKHIFINAVNFRKKHKYKFLVDMINSGDNWFREPILSGCTLTQVKNKEAYECSVNAAIKSMKEISCDTVSYRNQIEYTAQLREYIFEKNDILITKNELLESLVDKLCSKADKLDMPVPIVLSHGDLHPDNIWVDDNHNTIIIDWGSASFRSVWYDPATLLCKFRRREGRRRMLLNCNNSSVIDKVLINDEQKKYKMESVMAILLLEYLKEKINLLISIPIEESLVLDVLTEDIESIRWL